MYSDPQFLFFIVILIFICVVFMHISRKSSSLIYLYVVQSVVITLALLMLTLKNPSWPLILVVLVMFTVKVLVSPSFFFKLIQKHQVRFSLSSYLNTPLTLIGVVILTAITHASFFRPIAGLVSVAKGNTLLLAVAVILISLFLIINRRGALPQMLGILSLENGIVAFAAVAGLEQTPGLQLGIIFDIFVWVVIANVFASMIYKQFGSLDVASMTHLKEE